MNFIRNLVAGLSWRNPLVWGVALPLAILLGLGYEVSRFLAGVFHTTVMDGAGYLACFVTYFGLLGLALAVESWVRFGGGTVPSWLEKSNRIMIGGSLCAAFSMIAWQLIWSAGASGSFPREFWMVSWSTLVIVGLAGFGFGAMALGQRMGKEFIPGVALFLLLFNAGMAMTASTRGSFTTQARWGELYYVWRTPDCKAPAAKAPAETPAATGTAAPAPVVANEPPTPLSAWDVDAGVLYTFDVGFLWWSHPVFADRISNCEAQPLQYWSDPNQGAWVGKWNEAAQEQQAKLAWLSWIDRGFILLVVLAVLARFAFGGFGGGGGISVGKVLLITFGALVCGWTILCCGAEGLKVLDFMGVDTEVSALHGEDSPKLLRPFNLEGEGWHSVGRPKTQISGYLCQCGDTHHQVMIRDDLAIREVYASQLVSMAPHACSSQLEFGPQHAYKLWYYGTHESPVMQVLQAGETLACPDGSTVSAPPVQAAPPAAIVPA